MRHREVGDGNVFKQITSEIYDTNEAYAMLCILRNYLVHSNDVVHGVHIGFDGLNSASRYRMVKSQKGITTEAGKKVRFAESD